MVIFAIIFIVVLVLCTIVLSISLFLAYKDRENAMKTEHLKMTQEHQINEMKVKHELFLQQIEETNKKPQKASQNDTAAFFDILANPDKLWEGVENGTKRNN